MTPRKEFAGHLAWSATNAIGSIVVKMGVLIVTSRLVSPAEFGIYNIGMAFVLSLSIFGQLGIPTNLVVMKEETYSPLVTGLAIGLISGVFIVIINLTAASIFLPSFLTKYLPHFLLFGGLVTFQIFLNILEASARTRMEFRTLALNELAASFLGSGLATFALVFVLGGTMALIIGQFIYCVLKCLVLLRAAHRDLGRSRFGYGLKHLLDGSVAITLAECANMASVQMQRPIMGARLGLEAAGIWSRVYQIVLLQLTAVVQPLDNLILPIFARLRDEKDRFRFGLLAAIQFVGLVTLPICAITALIAPVAVPLLFGPSWTALIVPLQIGSAILFFRGMERLLLSAARASGGMRARSVIQIAQLAVIVGFLYVAAPHGLEVASWAFLAALLVGFALSIASMRHTTGLLPVEVLKTLAPGAALAAAPLSAASALALITNASMSAFIPLAAAAAALVAASTALWVTRESLLHPLVVSAATTVAQKLRPRTIA